MGFRGLGLVAVLAFAGLGLRCVVVAVALVLVLLVSVVFRFVFVAVGLITIALMLVVVAFVLIPSNLIVFRHFPNNPKLRQTTQTRSNQSPSFLLADETFVEDLVKRLRALRRSDWGSTLDANLIVQNLDSSCRRHCRTELVAAITDPGFNHWNGEGVEFEVERLAVAYLRICCCCKEYAGGEEAGCVHGEGERSEK
jgi:hypothetical protein